MRAMFCLAPGGEPIRQQVSGRQRNYEDGADNGRGRGRWNANDPAQQSYCEADGQPDQEACVHGFRPNP
jgi:hypothetical protein